MAITELEAPVTPADGTLTSATSQLNDLLVWASSALPPADGILASAVSTYNNFVDEQGGPDTALVERLCQVDPDESRNIALNPFCEGLFSILGGYITVAQMKTFYAMTVNDQEEMDTLIGRVTAYSATSATNERDRAVHRLRAIMTFWEQGDIPTYNTVAGIRSHFNAI
jgi:hypothetical protein